MSASEILAGLRAGPGSRVAVCDDNRLLSYAALREAVDAESRWLSALGVQRCAVLADNGVGWIVADLALMRSGSLHVPLPAWFTHDQVEHVLSDAGVDCILTDHPERVAEAHTSFIEVGVAPHSTLSAFRRLRPLDAQPLSGNAIKVTYTSGSTGAPKGVCLSLDVIETVTRSMVSAVPSGVERHLCITPLATLLENIAGVYAPLMLGATSYAPSSRTTGVSYGALDAAAFLKAMTLAAPSSLILPPELLRLLVAAAHRGYRVPSELRFVAVGGAAVCAGLLDEAIELGIPAYQGYGLSECASVVCLNTPQAMRRGSVGRPLPHARVRVDAGGQICVQGAVMNGYLGESTSTGEEIATGDLGSIDADGFVYVHGRIKNMFITSMGRNVTPEWVEAELQRNSSIGQAFVCGEGRPWLAALIYPSNASARDADIDDAVRIANARLPEHARVRAWWRLPQPLSFEDELLTANGRPRRDSIVARYASSIDSLYSTALAS
jgi:long-chain acyl-CoA synthetase